MLRVPDFLRAARGRAALRGGRLQRKVRSEAHARTRRNGAKDAGKQIAALAPGLALKYLARRALVRCGLCDRCNASDAVGSHEQGG